MTQLQIPTLKFSPANAKLRKLEKITGKKIFSLDLLAGKSCIAANLCKSYVIEKDGRLTIKDGPNTQFRCYAASGEALYKNAYELHKYNTQLVLETSRKSSLYIRDLILFSIPHNAGIIRLHSSGDFINRNYFKGCVAAAKIRRDIRWYCYTKCLPFIKEYVERKQSQEKYVQESPACDLSRGQLLPNLFVTASKGGLFDHYISLLNIRSVKVFFSEDEARQAGLVLDKTDELAANPGGDFGLLLHNSQPRGSLAASSWSKIKKTTGGYSRKKNLKLAGTIL